MNSTPENFSIEVSGLTKSYDKKKIVAVNDVSFRVNRGEIFGLIGPDGAGKTTIIRILTTLLLADSGRATVEGLEVVKDYKKIRSSVGYMPGRFSLYQDMTVEENLNLFATVFNTTIEENYDLVKDIYSQIEPFKDRRAGKLSGGMKQKLALSCALIHKPSVLFLDEPTTGVDPVSRKEFWGMLKNLKQQGITILVSTPYMDEANLCDRIALIHKGRLLKIDTPQNIIDQFGKTLWAVQGTNMPKLLTDLRLNNHLNTSFAFGDSHHVTIKDEHYTMKELEKYLIENGHEEILIHPVQASIEDCFMDIGVEKHNGTGFMKVIEANNLVKRFGDFTAVDNITFQVEEGEIFGFLGANGAGKTTAMRMFCGLSKPTSGNGSVAGFDIRKSPENIKRNIGYMSQKFSLYNDLKVWENIRLFAGIYGVDKKQIPIKTDELLQRLNFKSERNTLVKDLPLGWKQKLAFSVSIFHNPKVVFLDEPTGGVDPATRRQFWELIYEATSRGITVFVTTHYMDEAEYCNRVSIMVDGRIEALDTPKNLKQQYGAANMDEVFQQLARKAVRKTD